MVIRKRVLAPLLILAACSQRSTELTGQADKTSPFQDQQFLTLVGFTGSVVKREKRFTGYSLAAQRVSLIDPETESEVWGRQLSGTYDLTAPLSDYSGVALLSGQTLSVITDDFERTFAPIPFSIGYLTRAAVHPTYAAASLDGQQFHVVRRLEDGEWQQETVASPFVEPPSFTAPPGTEPPLAIIQLSGDGKKLIFFRPADGSYGYYTVDAAGSKLDTEPKVVCQGDGVGRPGKATYRSMVFDDAASLVVLGDRNGTISVFDPAAACVAPAARQALALGAAMPVTDVTQAGPGRIGVTQVGGRLSVLSYTVDGFQDQKTITDLCLYPLGALPVGQDGMALVCINAQGLSTDEERRSAPAAVEYDTVSVQLVSLVSGQPLFERAIDVEGTAGAALDPERGRVLMLKDSPIGILNVLDLATGAQHTRKGLFLDDILD